MQSLPCIAQRHKCFSSVQLQPACTAFVLNALNQQQIENCTDCMDALSVVIADTTMVIPGSVNATQSGQLKKEKNRGVNLLARELRFYIVVLPVEVYDHI